MALTDIFSQDKALKNLMSAYKSGRIPHAYIFAGSEGVGKQTTAKQWAKLLLCDNPRQKNNLTDSCSQCPSCKLFDANSHPDFHLVYKELKKFTKDGKPGDKPVELPIDVIREFLIQKAPAKPTQSKKKVFVVLEAEKLNQASQNALLKTLEEPPSFVNIILICTKMEKLLPTTKSRSQVIAFNPISEEIIQSKLSEMGHSRQKALFLARLSGGSLGQAIQLASIEDFDLFETKKNIIRKLSTISYTQTINFADELISTSSELSKAWAKMDKDTSKTDLNRRADKIMINIIISAFSDRMKLNLVPDEHLTNFDQINDIKAMAKRLNPQQAAEKITEFYRNLRWIDASVNQKLIFEQLLLNLFTFDKIISF